MKIMTLQVLLMDNDEVLCLGKSIGFANEFGKYLTPEVNTLWKCPTCGDVLRWSYDQMAEGGTPVCAKDDTDMVRTGGGEHA